MNKQWKKNQDQSFSFWVDQREIGRLAFSFSNLKKAASFSLGEKNFSISRIGFWNSHLLITNEEQEELVKVYAEKWYANHWVVEAGGKNYQLTVRNNPLAEYMLSEGETEILAYGLEPHDGRVRVKITGGEPAPDFTFDFLLWYLFAPIALENMGDQLNF